MSLRAWAYRRFVMGDAARRDAEMQREICAFDPGAPNPHLAAIVRHAKATVPYYREVFAAHADPAASFQSLPLLERDTVRGRYADLMSGERNPAECFEAHTGGSTGAALTVLQDRAHKDWVRATEEHYFREFLGVEPKETPTVVFWASASQIWGQKRGMRKRLGLWLTRTDLLGSSRITPQEMREGIDAINRRRPLVVKAYASPLFQIAKHVRAHNLRVHSPRLIVSLAETLQPHMRELVESVFGAAVFDFYGTREAGPIAGQCRRGAMHSFTFHAYPELVDANGDALAAGHEGRILVTTLHNRAMPLVRYLLGDAVEAGHPCDCGSRLPVLGRVAGRLLDYFPTRDGTLVYGGYFVKLMYENKWVDEFRIVQNTLDEVELWYVPFGDAPAADKLRAEERVRMVMGADCKVVWREVDSIPPTRHGKRMYTVSHVAERPGLNR
jgi:phenylacetate-CoA ligase